MTTSAQTIERAWRAGWEREPDLTVSEWADANRVLTERSSSEPGQWETIRFPFLREIMDILSARRTERRVVVMGGRQIGKTEAFLNWLGYIIQHAPGPVLIVEPNDQLLERVSKERIQPMLEETPVLADRISVAKSRDSGNTIHTKRFRGGALYMTTSNSSAGLRSLPIRYLLAEEADDYPDSVKGKGGALAIAESCTNNFPNRKVVINGNPGIKGKSRIEKEYLKGDQRRYFIRCPHCGHPDFLTWSGRDHLGAEGGSHHRIAWDEGAPETAHMVCGSERACRVEEHYKTEMLEGGYWQAMAPGDGETVSFQISSLYSPLGFLSWAKCALQFTGAHGDPIELKSFVQEVLGETWKEDREEVEARQLLDRVKAFPAEVPTGVGILVCSVDVQGDRLVVMVKGYGAGEESWLISYLEFLGDPARDEVWRKLDNFLVGRGPDEATGRFTHQSQRDLRIECTVIDSGGHHTDAVYRFCSARTTRRVFAIKGGSEADLPLVGVPSRNNSYRLPLFVLCVDTGKQRVLSRLKIRAPGPGFIHLPDWVDTELCEQLTAERAVYKWNKAKARRMRMWEKTRERNEAFDLEVYALAALGIAERVFMGPARKALPERAAKWAAPIDAGEKPAPAPDPLAKYPKGMLRTPRPTGWVNRFRR